MSETGEREREREREKEREGEMETTNNPIYEAVHQVLSSI